MGSWARIGLEPTGPPVLSTLASEALNIDEARLPKNEWELKDILLAECIRTGLYSLFIEEGEPIFHLRVKYWVKRKLGSIFPELLMPERSDDTEILATDKSVSLEFMGDIQILEGGYLMPANTRVIPTGGGSYLLISGAPTRAFPKLKEKFRITGIGRRLEGMHDDELVNLGFDIQPLSSYLGAAETIETPAELISKLLSSSATQWLGDSSWEIYLGSGTGQFGFQWGQYGGRGRNPGLVLNHHGLDLSLWRERIGQEYSRYWLSASSSNEKHIHAVAPQDWKRVCLALDSLWRRPREAILVLGRESSIFQIRIDFPPYEALYRWFLASGGHCISRKAGRDEWELPLSGLELTRRHLERLGVIIQIMQESERI